ncbi:MAG: hypothetical protein JNJ59_08505, partial [Deltaproteobacteria bacterium]|nr:hypothetical protein [Deltaproteobacteria bacterium]
MSRAASRLRCFVAAVVGLGVLPGLAAFARASSSAPALVPDSMVERWTTADGLPLDHLTDLVFGEDGALWLASYDGLARFDGDRFTVLRRATDPRLPSNRFVSLAAERTVGRQGRVWAVTEDGDLVRVGDLLLSSRGAGADGLAVWPANTLPSPARALVTAGQRLYALTARGLLDLTAVGPETRELSLDAESTPSAELNSLVVRADGVRFVGSEAQGVFRLRRGLPAERIIAPPSASRALRVLGIDESGTVWAGGSALYRIRDDHVEAVPATDPSGTKTPLVEPCDLVTRADGRVEVRDRRGWWRVDGAETVLVLPA